MENRRKSLLSLRCPNHMQLHAAYMQLINAYANSDPFHLTSLNLFIHLIIRLSSLQSLRAPASINSLPFLVRWFALQRSSLSNIPFIRSNWGDPPMHLPLLLGFLFIFIGRLLPRFSKNRGHLALACSRWTTANITASCIHTGLFVGRISEIGVADKPSRMHRNLTRWPHR